MRRKTVEKEPIKQEIQVQQASGNQPNSSDLKEREKAAKKHSEKIKGLMTDAGTYSFADDAAIESAGLLLALIDEAKELVKTHIQFYAKSGATAISPEINNLRGLMQDYRKFADDLGLTPKSRKKLDIQKKKEVKSSVLELRKKAI
jgi:phage terminase small subunit